MLEKTKAQVELEFAEADKQIAETMAKAKAHRQWLQ